MLSVPQSAYLRGALGLCLALSVPATLSAGAAQAQTKIITGMVAHGPPQWPQYATELPGSSRTILSSTSSRQAAAAPSSSLPVRLISAIAAIPISHARHCRARL